jgi:hypothetical protein
VTIKSIQSTSEFKVPEIQTLQEVYYMYFTFDLIIVYIVACSKRIFQMNCLLDFYIIIFLDFLTPHHVLYLSLIKYYVIMKCLFEVTVYGGCDKAMEW